jgi:hypothetical protein
MKEEEFRQLGDLDLEEGYGLERLFDAKNHGRTLAQIPAELEKLSGSDNPLKEKEDLTEFRLFCQLPTELRLIIWELALPRRVFELKACIYEAERLSGLKHDRTGMCLRAWQAPSVTLKPPTLLRVCREAREVAQRTGSFREIQNPNPEIWLGRRDLTHSESVKLWFDPRLDTLCLFSGKLFPLQQYPRNEFAAPQPSPLHAPFHHNWDQFARDTQTVCFDLEALNSKNPLFLTEWMDNNDRWTKVKNFRCYLHSVTLHMPKSHSTTQLFGSDADAMSVALVDVEDLEKLQLLRQMYIEESDPALLWPPLAKWLDQISNTRGQAKYVRELTSDVRNVWLQRISTMPRYGKYRAPKTWERLHRIVANEWASSHAIIGAKGRNPWKRDTLMSMPTFQMMIHVRLCTVDHVGEESCIQVATDRLPVAELDRDLATSRCKGSRADGCVLSSA